MNNAREKITDYLTRIEQAATPAEYSSVYRAMIKYHHFLSGEDCLTTNDLVQPYLDEIAQIKLPADPLMEQASELLSRVKFRVPQP